MTCIEEELTAVGKNAMPVLDFNAHKLEDSALGQDSLEWDTLEKAAAGLHRWLEEELKAGDYSDIHYGTSVNDHTSNNLEIHVTGEKLTAEQVRLLLLARGRAHPAEQARRPPAALPAQRDQVLPTPHGPALQPGARLRRLHDRPREQAGGKQGPRLAP